MKDTFAEKEIKIKRAEFEVQDIIAVEYTENGVDKQFKFNIRNGKTY